MESEARTGLSAALGCAALLGAISAVGDWVWARFIPDGAVVPGIAHGFVVFLVMAVVLGRAAGSARAIRRLIVSLPLSGLVIAALFYPVGYVVGYLPGLLFSWVLMWLTVAVLQSWARGSGESSRATVARGSLAAVASGLAFWAISGVWTDPDVGASNYLMRFVLWTLAFLPGFAALLVWNDRATAEPFDD